MTCLITAGAEPVVDALELDVLVWELPGIGPPPSMGAPPAMSPPSAGSTAAEAAWVLVLVELDLAEAALVEPRTWL